jgi:hypothetical protein
MSPELLPSITRALGIAVIERLPNMGYVLLAPAPAWLAGALGLSNTLPSAFPFLAHFLKIAGDAWHQGGDARADSGPFEAVINDEPVLLRASAFTIETRKLLVVEHLTGDADPRPVLQRAREQLLEREVLEKRAEGVHAPAAAVARDVAVLARLNLDAAARPVVERLQASAAALAAAVAPLPVPPPGARRASTKSNVKT